MANRILRTFENCNWKDQKTFRDLLYYRSYRRILTPVRRFGRHPRWGHVVHRERADPL